MGKGEEIFKFFVRFLQTQLLLARKEKHLTQAEMAEKIGVHVTTYGKWESGKSQPNIRELTKLASVLDIDIGRLFVKWSNVEENEKDISTIKHPSFPGFDGGVILSAGPERVQIKSQIDEMIKDWDEGALRDLLTWCSGYDKGIKRGRRG